MIRTKLITNKVQSKRKVFKSVIDNDRVSNIMDLKKHKNKVFRTSKNIFVYGNLYFYDGENYFKIVATGSERDELFDFLKKGVDPHDAIAAMNL